MLQRLESSEHAKLHVEKLHDDIMELPTRIISLEESISLTCLTIPKLRDGSYILMLLNYLQGELQIFLTRISNNSKLSFNSKYFGP